MNNMTEKAARHTGEERKISAEKIEDGRKWENIFKKSERENVPHQV